MTEQTGIVTRRFEPWAPIGTPIGLKSLLESQRDSIAVALPRHITPERLIKTMLVAANRTPKLLECTQASIMETINRAAELGLDLSGTLGECYPVPFNNKVKIDGRDHWLMQCQLIIGYRGMEKLAWQTGEVNSIDAEMVYSNDKFSFKKGTEVSVEWSPYLGGNRGIRIGAYCCVGMKSGGKIARFLSIDDIEAIRRKSKSGESPAWSDKPDCGGSYDEMGRKCAIKRALKDAPLSTEKFTRALEVDADDFEGVDILSAQTMPGQANDLASRIEDAKRTQSDGKAKSLPPEADAKPANSAGAQPEPEKGNAGGAPDGSTEDPKPTEGQMTPAQVKAAQDAEINASLKAEWPEYVNFLCFNAQRKTPELTRDVFDKWLAGQVLALGRKGKEKNISQNKRQEWYLKAVSGTLIMSPTEAKP